MEKKKKRKGRMKESEAQNEEYDENICEYRTYWRIKNKGNKSMETRRGTLTGHGNKRGKGRHTDKKRKLWMERTRISRKANGKGRKRVRYNKVED